MQIKTISIILYLLCFSICEGQGLQRKYQKYISKDTTALRVSISSPKEIYQIGEKIELKITIDNVSEKIIRVFNILEENLFLEICNDQNTIIYPWHQYHVSYYGHFPSNQNTINPNYFIGTNISIITDTTDTSKANEYKKYYKLTSGKKYKISVTYSSLEPDILFRDIELIKGAMKQREIDILKTSLREGVYIWGGEIKSNDIFIKYGE